MFILQTSFKLWLWVARRKTLITFVPITSKNLASVLLFFALLFLRDNYAWKTENWSNTLNILLHIIQYSNTYLLSCPYYLHCPLHHVCYVQEPEKQQKGRVSDLLPGLGKNLRTAEEIIYQPGSKSFTSTSNLFVRKSKSSALNIDYSLVYCALKQSKLNN